MTQFQNPYETPAQFGGQPPMQQKRNSGLAVGALICSLVFCCPITTILGVLLGLIAFVSIGNNPMLKGRGLAVVAVLIGVIATAGQGVGGYLYYDLAVKPVMHGPRDMLTAGFNGDLNGMRDELVTPAAAATDEELTAFVTELRDRYGEFVSCAIDEGSQASPTTFGATSMPFPYVFEFKNQTIIGEAELMFSDPNAGGIVMKWASITIFDGQLGDVSLPAGPSGMNSGSTGAPDAVVAPETETDSSP
jgi:hypothetical protein